MTPSLTEYELQLATDPQIMISKNIIIQKVYKLFGSVSEKYKEELADKIFDQNLISPKISRGENYHGLPYVILDFPRQFSKEDTFAIRSFFWWGNFFSITLHLAGRYQQQYAAAIQNAINNDFFAGWYIAATAGSQWEHHFGINNYALLSEKMQSNIEELPFLKLSKKIPLTQWDEANTFFSENFRMLAEILNTYAPMR